MEWSAELPREAGTLACDITSYHRSANQYECRACFRLEFAVRAREIRITIEPRPVNSIQRGVFSPATSDSQVSYNTSTTGRYLLFCYLFILRDTHSPGISSGS
jgi:hypothetical protein